MAKARKSTKATPKNDAKTKAKAEALAKKQAEKEAKAAERAAAKAERDAAKAAKKAEREKFLAKYPHALAGLSRESGVSLLTLRKWVRLAESGSEDQRKRYAFLLKASNRTPEGVPLRFTENVVELCRNTKAANVTAFVPGFEIAEDGRQLTDRRES